MSARHALQLAGRSTTRSAPRTAGEHQEALVGAHYFPALTVLQLRQHGSRIDGAPTRESLLDLL